MSAPPFSANIAIQYDDSSPIWKDTAGTTPATLANDVIQRIDDVSGNGYNATIFSGRTGAVLQPSLTGGKRGFVFSNQNVYSLGTPAGLLSVINSTTNWTVFWFGVPATANGFIFSKCAGGSARVNVGVFGGAINNYNILASNSQVPLSGSPQSLCYCTPHSLAGVGTKMYLNGAADSAGSTSTLPAADTTNPVGFGGQGGAPAGAYSYSGSVNVFLLYNRSLLPPEVMQVSDYYFNYYGVANPRKSAPFYIVWDSNSISMLGGTPNVPNTVQQTLGLPQGALNNLSLPGKTSTQIIGESPQAAWPLLPLMREGKPILYLGYEGTNEPGGPNSIQSCIAAKAQGFDKAITATTTPGQTLGVFQAGNSYIRANWQTPACNIDGLVDLASDPIAGNPFNWISNGYYSSDGLHPTNGPGVNLLAGLWRSTIRSVAASTNAVKVYISSINTAGCTLACTAPAYGVGPYNIQFQQAPDVSGAPGAFANIGTSSSALSNVVTGLSQNTPYWFRAVTADAGGAGIATTLYEPMTTSATPATAYTITGPTGGAANVGSTAFTVTPNGSVTTDTVSIAITGGGACTPSSLNFNGLSTPLTFLYTPNATGAKTLTLTSGGAFPVSGSPWSYTSDSRAAASYTITGPNSGATGVASATFTITPNGVATDTITLGGAGTGTFSSGATITFAGSATPQTFTYTPGSAGTKALTFASANALTFPGGAGWYYYSTAASTTFALTGTSPVQVGYGSTTFTVTPSVGINDSVVLSDDGAGGSFTPPLLTFVSTVNQPQQVVYVARTVSVGAGKVRAQSAAFSTITGSPFNLTRNTAANSSYVVAGPLMGVSGVASTNFTVTPKGVTANDTITFSDGGAGGTFNPTSLTWTNSALVQTFSYTPASSGVRQITLTSSTPLTINGNGFYYTAVAAPVVVVGGGTTYIFGSEG